VDEDAANAVRTGPILTKYDDAIGVVIVTFDDGATLDLDLAQRTTPVLEQVTEGQPRPLLVDCRNLRGQTREARVYFASEPSHVRHYTAVALVVGNALSRVIANFFIGINKPDKPTRLFDDPNQAIEWLRGHSAENQSGD
jgi:hypothetical protein